MMSDSDMYVGMERTEARYIYHPAFCGLQENDHIMIPTGERIHMHVQLVARLDVNANLTFRQLQHSTQLL